VLGLVPLAVVAPSSSSTGFSLAALDRAGFHLEKSGDIRAIENALDPCFQVFLIYRLDSFDALRHGHCWLDFTFQTPKVPFLLNIILSTL